MNKSKINPDLKPSGINSNFYGENLSFDEYVLLMSDIISRGRQDLNDENKEAIVQANSPFALSPLKTNQKIKNGVLLIHGLFDSPFYVTDLGDYFLKKGFVVRAILLPGHGTVSGDLLNIDAAEWIKAVNYGINSLAKEVDNIYVAAYSLGGLLSLYHYLQNRSVNIRGMVLFAPALEPKNYLRRILAKHHRLFSWTCDRAKWFQIATSINYTKYSSYSFNAGFQACRVMDEVRAILKSQKVAVPLFIVLSADDETVSNKPILSFFLEQPNPNNKLIIYTNENYKNLDPRIIQRSSYFPMLKIMNFSHTCITISPQNPLLGCDSPFFDCPNVNINQIPKNQLHWGAATKNNLKNLLFSRLTYNPDFNHLLKYLDEFFDGIV